MIIAVEVLLILVVLIGFYVVSKLDQLQHPDMGEGDTSVNESIEEDTVATMSGYTTVALFGLDTRESGQLGKGNRSDTIIIASINNDTGEVRLASVFRDTYLDLTIEKYISVDFAAMTDAVDLLGGIDIDVDETEIDHLNNYMVETSKVTGVASKPLTHTGLQTLDGVQATSYCRIRYTAGDDFKRTERQREVIQELVRKAKTMEISKINDIINAVFPKIATNYSNKELLEMAPQMIGYDIADTAGFPFDRETGTISGRGSCVIPVNLAENVRQLHEFLYENYDYTPSSEVQKISEQITADTGY